MPIKPDLRDRIRERIKECIAGNKLDPLLTGYFQMILKRDRSKTPEGQNIDGYSLLEKEISINLEGTPIKEYPYLVQLVPGIYSAKCSYLQILEMSFDPGITYLHQKKVHRMRRWGIDGPEP